MDRRRPDNQNLPVLASAGEMVTTTTTARRVPSARFQARPVVHSQLNSNSKLTRVKDWKPDDEMLAGVAWMKDGFVYYRVISQIRKVLNTKANTLAACRLRVKRIDPRTGEPEATTDERVMRVWNAFRGPHGGKRELMRKFSLLADVTGEAFLIGVPQVDSMEVEHMEAVGDMPAMTWEFVSRSEIQADKPDLTGRRRGRIFRDAIGALSLAKNPIPGTSYIARWWNADPEHTELPDSAMRSILPDAQEYVQLRDVVTGAIKQRMAAGILLIPDDMSFGTWDETLEQEGEFDDDSDPLLVTLEDHMGAAVEDRRSAAGFVPLILMGEAADLKEVRLVDLSFGNKNIEWATPLRDEKLRMMAQGLPAPPETMKGKGELNHWTGYNVDQELASNWVIPQGEDLAAFVTEEYLRPMLEEYEGMPESESAFYVVVLDPANIIAKADVGITAIRLYDRRILSALAAVEANNFTSDDMPEQAELAMRLAWDLALRDPSLILALASPLGLDKLPGLNLQDLIAAVERRDEVLNRPPIQLPEGEGDEEDDEDGTTPEGDMPPIENDDPESGGGEPEGESRLLRAEDPNLTTFDRLVRDLTLIADGQAERALEKAANRLRSLASKAGADPAAKDRMNGQANRDVLMLVTDEDLGRLGTSPEALMHDAWDGFAARATTLISRHLADESHSTQREQAHRTQFVVEQLVTRLQDLILGTGGDRRFDGLLVDEDLVREVLELEVSPLGAGV